MVLAMLVFLRELDRGGQPPFMKAPVVLDLDSTQQHELQTAFGVTVDRWVFDAHTSAARYTEDWSAVRPSTLVGERCEIVIGDATPTDVGRVPIHLGAHDGHASFGTGRHPATRLALVQVEHHLSPGDSVIDVGTGSGILAIAAARLGAASVRAFDVDANAARLARANVARNDLACIVSVRAGALRARAASTDLIVANLVTGDVVKLAPAFARALVPGGVLVASGVVVAREHDVLAAANDAGLETVSVEREGRWSSLAFRRPPSPPVSNLDL